MPAALEKVISAANCMRHGVDSSMQGVCHKDEDKSSMEEFSKFNQSNLTAIGRETAMPRLAAGRQLPEHKVVK